MESYSRWLSDEGAAQVIAFPTGNTNGHYA
jgi:hypothetical protein